MNMKDNSKIINRSSMKMSYRNNIFHIDFNNFNVFLTIFNVLEILRSLWWLLSVRSCVKWRPVICHSMKISWLASAWWGFLMRNTFDHTFILVLALMLILMILLSVIWIAIHVKLNFLNFIEMDRFNYF